MKVGEGSFSHTQSLLWFLRHRVQWLLESLKKFRQVQVVGCGFFLCLLRTVFPLFCSFTIGCVQVRLRDAERAALLDLVEPVRLMAVGRPAGVLHPVSTGGEGLGSSGL